MKRDKNKFIIFNKKILKKAIQIQIELNQLIAEVQRQTKKIK